MLRYAYKLLVPVDRKNGYFAQINVSNIASNATKIRFLVTKPAICFEPNWRDVQQQIFAAGIGGFWLGFIDHFAVQTEVNSKAKHASAGSKLNKYNVFIEKISGVDKKRYLTSLACC